MDRVERIHDFEQHVAEHISASPSVRLEFFRRAIILYDKNTIVDICLCLQNHSVGLLRDFFVFNHGTSAVNFSPVPDAHDSHLFKPVVDFVHDAVVAYANAPIVSRAGDFVTTRRPGICGQSSNVRNDAAKYFGRQRF
jgi:hypothetical protein